MAATFGWGAQARGRDERALVLALLASLLAHAAFLFAIPGLREARKPVIFPGPLIARLVAPPPAPQVQMESRHAEPVAAPPRARPASPARPAPAPKEDPALAASASVAREPVAEPLQPAQAPPSAPEPPAAAARSGPQPAAAAPSAPDAGSLARYRIEIMNLARRFKRYPRLAVDNNWEGRVVVRLVVGADGALSALNVKSSAGHEALDQEALAMIRQAKAAAAIPQALRGREFALEVPVIFSLKEDAG